MMTVLLLAGVVVAIIMAIGYALRIVDVIHQLTGGTTRDRHR